MPDLPESLPFLERLEAHVEGLMNNEPGLSKADKGDTVRALLLQKGQHDANRRKVFHYEADDIPGWRVFFTTPNRDEPDTLLFAGVTNQGAFLQGIAENPPPPLEAGGYTAAGAEPGKPNPFLSHCSLAIAAKKAFDTHPFSPGVSWARTKEGTLSFFVDENIPNPFAPQKKPRGTLLFEDWVNIADHQNAVMLPPTSPFFDDVLHPLLALGVNEDTAKRAATHMDALSLSDERQQARRIAQGLEAVLDPGRLSCAKDGGDFSSLHMNWLSGFGKDMGTISDTQQARSQKRQRFSMACPALSKMAANAYAVLVTTPDIYLKDATDPSRWARNDSRMRPFALAWGVDANDTPAQAVAHGLMNDSQAHQQGLLTLPREGIDVGAMGFPGFFMEAWCATDSSHLPKDAQTFADWTRVIADAQTLRHTGDRSLKAILSGVGHDWARFAKPARNDGYSLIDMDHALNNHFWPAVTYRAGKSLGIPEETMASILVLDDGCPNKPHEPGLNGHTLLTARNALGKMSAGMVESEDKPLNSVASEENMQPMETWKPLLGNGRTREGHWQELTSRDLLSAYLDVHNTDDACHDRLVDSADKRGLVFALTDIHGNRSALLVDRENDTDTAIETSHITPKGVLRRMDVADDSSLPMATAKTAIALISGLKALGKKQWDAYAQQWDKHGNAQNHAALERKLGFPIADDAGFAKLWAAYAPLLPPSMRVQGPAATVAMRAASLAKDPCVAPLLNGTEKGARGQKKDPDSRG